MYQIISDGSCDLPEQLAKDKGVEVVPFYVSFDEKTYYKEIEEMPIRKFYDEMVEKENVVFPKSSLPSIEDFIASFEKYVKQGIPIICICITVKFSGSYQAAMNARSILLETYPDAKIEVIDSTINTVLQGMYVLEAVKLQEQGVPYEEAVQRLLSIRETGRIFFTVGNVDYLKHGGRIGKLSGLAASVLGIRPLITLKEGEIFPSGLSRSRRKSQDAVVNLLDNHVKSLQAAGENMADYIVDVGYGYDIQEAEEFLARIREKFRGILDVDQIQMYQIGATIAVHTGPYPLGVGFLKKA